MRPLAVGLVYTDGLPQRREQTLRGTMTRRIQRGRIDVETSASFYPDTLTTVDVAGTTNGSARTTPEPTARAATRVGLTLLGGFEVRVEDDAIAARHWSRRQSSALVKLLAMSPSRSLHRELVIDALWPHLGIDDAAPRLHKAAHYARKLLGRRDAVVLTGDAVYLWPDGDVHIDMVQFRHLAESAVSTGNRAAAKRALALYGGELLPQDLYEPWAEQHRLHLRRLYLELLRLAEDWHQVLAADPADESAHLALARRHADRGDRVAALRQLDQLDGVMRQELGLEPSDRARQLRSEIFMAAPSGYSSEEVNSGGHVAPCFPLADPRPQCCDVSAEIAR
jgi:DNA-binding SARP family transcriptional activator